MSIDFIHHDSDSVSINVVHCSSHISQNNQKTSIKLINIDQKINQKQLKYLVLILIKTSLTLYTAEFYSSADQLQLKVKKIAD